MPVFLEWKLTATNHSKAGVYLFQNRSQYWTFRVEAVALWLSGKRGKGGKRGKRGERGKGEKEEKGENEENL